MLKTPDEQLIDEIKQGERAWSLAAELAAQGLPKLEPEPEQPQQARAPALSFSGPSSSLLPSASLRGAFENTATKYNVPVNVLMAMAHVESGYDPMARNPKPGSTASGIMQYIRTTAKSVGINPFNPEQAIEAAAKQIRARLDAGGTMEDAVMGHHGGDGAFQNRSWNDADRQYAKTVLGRAGKIGEMMMAEPVKQQAQTEKQAAPSKQSAISLEGLPSVAGFAQAAPSGVDPVRFQQLQGVVKSMSPEQREQAKKEIEARSIGDMRTPEDEAFMQIVGQPATAKQRQAQSDAAYLRANGLGYSAAQQVAERNAESGLPSMTRYANAAQEQAAAIKKQEIVRNGRTWGEALDDTNKAFAQGAYGLVAGGAWLMNKAGIGDGATAKYLIDYTQKLEKNKSARAQLANQEVEEAKGVAETFGALIDNPTAILDQIMQSATVVAPGIGMGAAGARVAGGAAARRAATEFAKRGASAAAQQEAAALAYAAAATPAAIWGGRTGEALASGSMTGSKIQTTIESASFDELRMHSSRFRELEATQGQEAARKQLANEAAAAGAALSGAGTFGGSIVAGKINKLAGLDDVYSPLTGKITPASGVRNLGAQTIEEVGQSPIESVGENVGKRMADNRVDIYEDMGKQALLGAVGAVGQTGATISGGKILNRKANAESESGEMPRSNLDSFVAAESASNAARENALNRWNNPWGANRAQPASPPAANQEAKPAPNGPLSRAVQSTIATQLVGESPVQQGNLASWIAEQDATQQGEPANAAELASLGEAPSATESAQAAPEVVEPAVTAPAVEPKVAAPSVEATKPAELNLSEMDEPALRERLKYVAQQAKMNGWTKPMQQERKRIEAEINKRVAAQQQSLLDQQTAPAPAATKQQEQAVTAPVAEKPSTFSATHETPYGEKVAKINGEWQDAEGTVYEGEVTPIAQPAVSQQKTDRLPKASETTAPVSQQKTDTPESIRAKSGEPFKSLGVAKMQAAKHAGYEPVQVEGGWELRKAAAQPIADHIPDATKMVAVPATDESQEVPDHINAYPADDVVKSAPSETIVDGVDQDTSTATTPTDVELRKAKERLQRVKRNGDPVKIKAAETRLRKMRQSIFDAEDWVKAAQNGDESAIQKLEDAGFADTADNLRSMLPRSESQAVNDYLDGKREEAPTVEEVKAEKSETAGIDRRIAETASRIESMRQRQKDAEKIGNAWVWDSKIADAEKTLSAYKQAKQSIENASTQAQTAEKQPESAPVAQKQDATQEQFAGNKIFTADKVSAARERMRKKLGQLNSGLDPELMIDGMTIAGAYIESGVRSFSDYAKAMIDDMGNGIKPYLLSFWEGARNYPGLNTEGMTSTEESAKQHAELNRELPAEVAEAMGSEVKKPTKRTKKTGAKSDMTLTQDWGVDHINGYGDHYDRETGNSVKDQFLKESAKYLAAIADKLQEAGFVAHEDGKGRPQKPVSTSEGGTAGSGDVNLTMRHPDTGVNVYINVGETSLRGVVPTTPSGIAVMFRVSSKEGDRYATSGTNRWSPVDLSAADLTNMVLREVAGQENAMTRPAQLGSKQNADTQSTENVADRGDEGRQSGRVQADGTREQTGAVSGKNDGPVRSKRGGSGPADSQQVGVESRAGQNPADQHGDTGSREDSAGASGRGNPGNYRISEGELKRVGSWKATAEQNVKIVETVKQILSENRAATEEERALLTKFTGWGASEIANGVFPNRYGQYKDASWQALGERLQAALTPEEYAQAKRTTQYAHYTSEPAIRSVYAALQRMGFNGGKVMEPGMGVGLFNGLMPESMANHSQYTGIEYDTITGNIAKLLYPDSNIVVGDFTQTKLPRDFFDVAIGNPPFGNIKILSDAEYKKHSFLLHDYFFAKTIDRVKPGGLLVFVTSKGTMDKANDRARKYLAERADLVGAIRMPQTAFKDNAGTEVVTDVIFLRKRLPGEQVAGEDWAGLKEVTTPQGPASINEYFATHPEMVLGEHALTGSMYRANEYTVIPKAGDIEQQFAQAIENLPENIYRPARGSQTERAAVQRRDYDPKVKKEGGLYVADDGTLMQVESGQGVPLTHRKGADGKLIELKPKDVQFLKDWTGVRDALKQAQYDQLNDGNWQDSLAKLNKAYDAFVAKHGELLAHSVSERENEDGSTTVTRRYKNIPSLREDVEGSLIYALESINESDNSISKGPVLLGRTINKPQAARIETTQDAMFVSLNEVGALDLAHVAKLAGKSEQEVIADLGNAIYRDPSGTWTTADDYLSGNVVRKLKEAEVAARLDKSLQRNVDALKEVQPKALAPQDIAVQLGAHWIPASDVQQFAKEALESNFEVNYSPITGQWSVEGRGGSVSEWSAKGKDAADLMEAVLNNRQIKITYKDSEGKTYTDAEATEKANDVAKKMRAAFKKWIWSDTNRAERLATFYNENYNNIAPRTFDGSHLTLPGVSARFSLREHQKRAIWRTIQQGDTYYAHAVGAGKTFTMIAAGMEERRLGLSKKPMYVVPNHMLAQFSKEFLELYPTAQIMVADEQNFHTHNRRKFVAQAALNDPDAIVITHSAFGRIGMSKEFSQTFIQEQIEQWQAVLDESDSSDRITRKQIERRIEQLENRLKAIIENPKDQLMTFEELGVDRLFVDEAHEFRKLDFATNRGNIKGIDPSGSQRAMDLFMKVQYLREKNPGRALVMASGTPVTNTMGELYTVQRFFDQKQMAEDGDSTFDAWSNHYGEVVDGLEQNAAGGYESVSRFAKFVNVPELMSRVRSFMDILTSEQLGDVVQRPDVKTGSRQIVVTPVPDGFKAYQKDLEQRIQAIRARKGPPKPGDDIILSVIADGRFSAIDMRFVDPTLPSDPNSKLNRIIDDMLVAYHESANNEYATGAKVDPLKGASMMLFTDIGLGEQSAANRGFNMKEWIEKRLVEGGVDPAHIAFMRDNKAHAKKERLFDDLRQGRKRILIGGKDMETGVNAQKRLAYLFHLDAPWFPASVEQREGRIVRQGNQNREADVRGYATKGSYDSTMWGMNARKQRFIEQAMRGDSSMRSMEDVSEASAFEMAAALASGDERYLKLAGLKGDVERLTRLHSAHLDEQRTLGWSKQHTINSIAHNKRTIEALNAALAKRELIRPGDFKATVNGKTYDSRDEFSQAAFDAFQASASASEEGERSIGKIGGMDLQYIGVHLERSNGFAAELRVDVPGENDPLLVWPLDPATNIPGIATRAANRVNGLDRQLQEVNGYLVKNQSDLDKIERRLGAAFPEQSELNEKRQELAELESELAAEGKEASAEAAAATAEVDQDSARLYSRNDRSSIETASRRMYRFVSEFERGSIKDSDTQILGETPTVLQFLGAKNLPLQIDGATVRKTLEGKHKYDLSPELLWNVAQYLYDPLAVFSSTNGRGFVVLTEVPSNTGKPVVAAIHVSKQHGGIVINDVASVHEKSDAERSLSSWIAQDLLLYVRNENDLSGAATRPLLPASVAAQMKGRIDSVATEADVVNRYGSRYSQGASESAKQPASTIPQIRAALLEAFGNRGQRLLDSGSIVIVQSESDVHGNVDPIQSEDSYVQAFYDPKLNKVYLVADGLEVGDVRSVVAHEGVHWLEKNDPRVMRAVMRQITNTMETALFNPGGVEQWFKKAWRTVPPDTHPRHVPSEVAAYAVTHREQAPFTIKKWINDMLAGFRLALTRLGFNPKQFTDADLAAMARYSLRRMSGTETLADRLIDRAAKLGEKFGASAAGGSGALAIRKNSVDPVSREKFAWRGVVQTHSGPEFYGNNFALQARSEINTESDFADGGFADHGIAGHTAWVRDGDKSYVFAVLNQDGDAIGRLVADVRNGAIVAIHDIKAYTRNAGLGSNVVAHIAANTSGQVNIIEATDDAQDFWNRLGAGYIDHYKNTAIDWQGVKRYLAGRPGPDSGPDRAGKRQTSEQGRAEASGSDARGIEAQELSAEEAAKLFESGAFDRKYSKKSDPHQDKSLVLPDQTAAERIQENIQDAMQRVKQLQKRIEKVTWREIGEPADYYGAETNRPGRIAARLEDGREKLFQPLIEELAKSGHALTQLEELLHAQHAPERYERLKDIGGNEDKTAEELVGMSLEKAAEIRKRYATNDELHAIANKARDITRLTMEMRKLYGLVTPEQYQALTDEETAYQFYVPLKGDGEYGPKLKRAMGHGEREEHILENIFRDYELLVVAGEKNLARQSLLQLAIQNPDPDLWTVGVTPKGRTISPTTIYRVMYHGSQVAQFSSHAEVRAFIDADSKRGRDYVVEDERGEQIAEFAKHLQDNEVPVYVNGRMVRIQINDEKLAEQIRPLDGAQLGSILDAMRRMNRFLASVYTGYNPAFILRNAARDAMTGTINMIGNEGAITAAKAWALYPAALKAMTMHAATEQDQAGEMGKFLREYRMHGGKTGASYMSDLEEQGVKVQRMFEDARGVAGSLADGKKLQAARVAGRKLVGGLAHGIEVLNQGTENALRLALFAALRKQGVSPGNAAQAAKAVTVNFDRKGKLTPTLGALYLFINPAIQGTANAYRTLTHGEHKAQAWAALGGLALLGFLAGGMGMDDDKDRWLGAGWDQRSKNFRLRLGSKTINIPVSQEFAPFYAFGVAMAEASRGESAMKSSARMVSSMMDAYVPFRNLFNPESDKPLLDASLAVTPTMIKPLAEIGSNRNSFGSKIVPETDNAASQPDNLKMYRATKGSTADNVAQGMAKAGEMIGKGRYENDWTKVSPETIKYLWRTYTGGLGQFILDSADLAKLSATAPSDIEVGNVPIAKDFIKQDSVRELRTRFNDLKKETTAASSETRSAKKAGDGEAMDRFYSDPEKAYVSAMSGAMMKYGKIANTLRDLAVEINADKKLSDSQKRAEVKKLEAEEELIYRDALSLFAATKDDSRKGR